MDGGFFLENANVRRTAMYTCDNQVRDKVIAIELVKKQLTSTSLPQEIQRHQWNVCSTVKM